MCRRTREEHIGPFLLGSSLVLLVAALTLRFWAAERLWNVRLDPLYGGGNGYVGLSQYLVMLGLSGLAGLQAAEAASANRGRPRAAGLLLLLLAVVNVLSVHPWLAREDIDSIPARGAPLVRAIERYSREQGRYPASLDELTPRYLRAIPRTGLSRSRQFEYLSPQRRGRPYGNFETTLQGKSPYALVVKLVPNGTLLYRPCGNYTDLTRGRKVQTNRGWFHSGID